MRTSLFRVVGLVAVWVALWGDLTWANLLGGLAVSAVILALFRTQRAPGGNGTVRPLPALGFTVYFLWKLVEASAVVAWEVVTPSNRINEAIVAVPIRGVSDAVTTVVANAISLIPGTLTLEARRSPTTLYVHVLHLHEIEDVRREVQRFEVLAIRAFGPTEALRHIDEGRHT